MKRMNPSRRNFIKTIAVGMLGKGLISSFPFQAFGETEKFEDGFEIQKGFKVFNRETQKSMEALADTLVPGAKKLGIKQIFMDNISKDPGAAGFFDAGFWNLDTISKTKFKKPFYALEKKEQKEEVINHVSIKNRTFFKQFRETIINLYYTHPEVWKKLSYNGPPQPRGFMDYASPPEMSGG